MTQYSPIDNEAVHDSSENEWIDLRNRISQISRVGSPLLTISQHGGDEDSSPVLVLTVSGAGPESPLSPPGPPADCGQTDLDHEESYHKSPGDAEVQSRCTNGKPLSFLDRLRNGWLWEVLGLVVCVLSFGAIVGIISAYSDQQVPRFSYGVTVSPHQCFLIMLRLNFHAAKRHYFHFEHYRKGFHALGSQCRH
jgi:hypothetical protein